MAPGPDVKQRHCNKCDAPNAQILCLQCRDAAWCCVECQKKDWLTHKGYCRERVLTADEQRGWAAPALPEQAPAEAVPADSCWHELPESCCVWQQDGAREEVARGDARWLAVAGEAPKPRVQGRVSVVVATMHERYRFHSQLWLCFHAQTHVDKELIVIDSGEAPSPFFRERMSATVKYVFTEESLSVGEKRNLAIREHSTGEIIANFDDDDVYFPAYLQTMVKHLTSSKAALVHLSAWSVLDLEANFCATFDAAVPRPSVAAASSQLRRSGFAMAYTHAAWRCATWPPLTSGEDCKFLEAVEALGLPVATRAETARGMTVLHLQHGANVGRSLCQTARKDRGAVALMLSRFEEACRRIIKLSMSEYDQMGGGLLYKGLHRLALCSEAPSPPRGLFLAEEKEGLEEAWQAWLQSAAGMRQA